MSKQGAKHPSRLSALVHCRCPRCREGELFERPAYRLDAFYKMYPMCPNCKQDFQIEPGFYMGASYIGYGFTVLITLIGAFLYTFVFPEAGEWTAISWIIFTIMLFIPLIFRYARTVMLHGLGSIKYSPEFNEKPKGIYVGPDGQLHEGSPPERTANMN